MESENRRDLNSVLENARAQLEMLTVSSHENIREPPCEQIKPNKENEDKSGHLDQGSASSTEGASVEEYTKELKSLSKNDDESVDEEESSNKNFDSSITSLGDQRSFQNDLTNQNELTSQTTYTNIHDVKNPENDEILVVTNSKMDDIPLSNENSRGVSQQDQQSFIEDSPSIETTNTTGTTATVESIKKPDVIPHNQMNKESVGTKLPETPVEKNITIEESNDIETTRQENNPDTIEHEGIRFSIYANPLSGNEASEDSLVDEFEQNYSEQDENEQLLNVAKFEQIFVEQDENEQLINDDKSEQKDYKQDRNEKLLNVDKFGQNFVEHDRNEQLLNVDKFEQNYFELDENELLLNVDTFEQTYFELDENELLNVDKFEQTYFELDENEQLLNIDKFEQNFVEHNRNEQLLNINEFEQNLGDQNGKQLLNRCMGGEAIESSNNFREYEISQDSVMEAACQTILDGPIERSKIREGLEISKDSVIDEGCQIISVFDTPLEPNCFITGQNLNANQAQYLTNDGQLEFVQNYEEINRNQNNVDFDEGFVDDGFVDSRDRHPAKIIFVAEQDDEGSNKPFDTEDDISSLIENSDGSPLLHDTPSLTNLRIPKEEITERLDANQKLWDSSFRTSAPPLNLLNTNMTQALVTFSPPPNQPAPPAVPSLPEILENILLLKPSEMISHDDFVSDNSQCFDSGSNFVKSPKNAPKIVAVQPKTSSPHENTQQTDSDTNSETPITSITTDDDATLQTENDDSLPVLNSIDRALLANMYNRPPTPFENILPIQSPNMSTTVDHSSDSTKNPPRVPTRVIQKKIKFKFIKKLFGIKNVRSKN